MDGFYGWHGQQLIKLMSYLPTTVIRAPNWTSPMIFFMAWEGIDALVDMFLNE